jgi:hypothetical protein
VHHHSKGNQAARESIDRSSGAGSHGRDADTILDFTDHEQTSKANPIFTVSVTVRDFKPVDDFVVRWEFPLFVKDRTGLDPGNLKQKSAKQSGRPAKEQPDMQAIMAALYGAEKDGGLTWTQLKKASGVPRTTLNMRLKKLKAQGEIIYTKPTQHYSLSLKNAQDWHATI